MRRDLRAELPDQLRDKNLYVDQLPPELVDEAWERFRDAAKKMLSAPKAPSPFGKRKKKKPAQKG